ncbi:Chondroitin AC/alginate lyase [Mycena sanguinolenta]|uniref:Chondroitin AC/alginate lyase n=1 Tax=Mycena sanguinolenta TaxID=230812 RepID=A0A8H7D4V4_9AGAR|nr:Chondroitin AC/alginate lyase [Mycena sanguinolenta]
MLSAGFSNHTPYSRAIRPLFLLLCVSGVAFATNPFVQYAVDFPDPTFVTTEQFGARFAGAEATIVAWADEMASHGPWTVTSKPVVAPSNDTHDYMSWAPYEWANCSNVKNTTVLSLADESRECNFVFRDGQVNPERFIIQDFQSFFNLSDAVLYNSIAAVLQNKSSSVYSQNVAKFVNTWFLDSATAMNPNLNYAQMNRGPGGQTGAYTGILDLRGFAKIAAGILMLRASKNTDWTSDLDSQFVAWCNKYIGWLDTSPTGQQAAHATNNHGTIFVAQYAALKLIVNDVSSAVNWTQGYFSGKFQNQINSTGDQPEEASRETPYHYRNFNIAGMVTNARLLSYADPTSTPWNTTAQGQTIQGTVDFLMTVNPAATNEQAVKAEIYPNIAAIASAYGDPTGKYVGFLNATGFAYADDATFLWDQPLAGGDTLSATNATDTSPGSTAAGGKNGDRSLSVGSVERLCLLAFVLLLQFM